LKLQRDHHLVLPCSPPGESFFFTTIGGIITAERRQATRGILPEFSNIETTDIKRLGLHINPVPTSAVTTTMMQQQPTLELLIASLPSMRDIPFLSGTGKELPPHGQVLTRSVIINVASIQR